MDNIFKTAQNLSDILGYWSGTAKIVCRQLEYVIDNNKSYLIDELGRQQIIAAVEEIKLCKRICDEMFNQRDSVEFDTAKWKSVKELINKTHRPNENRRTDSLDA